MKISSLGYPPEFQSLFDNQDFDLYRHQEDAITAVRNGDNVIVSVPTASGKTLIAYVAIYERFLRKQRSVYMVPLKALASEKFQELKKLRSLGMKVSIAVGDYDESPQVIRKSDVVVATSEKLDSMIRHDPSIVYEMGLLVADEVHLIGDPSRGPIEELVLATVSHINPDTRILCLSATMTNHEQISEWTDSVPVVSDFRPVPLTRGIIFRKKLVLEDESVETLESGDEIQSIISKHVNTGGQLLVFVNSRKRAENLASTYAEKLDLNNTANTGLVGPEEEQDIYDSILSDLVTHGIAFHHAGLSNRQRNVIEKMFRERKLKVLFATPTLAAGVNLPARAVIVRDLTRYSDGYSQFIPNMEINQMIGRAGRPGFDVEGFAYLYAASEKSLDRSREIFLSDPDPIMSSLGAENMVRRSALALVSMGICRNEQELISFFSGTLYAFQNGNEFFENHIPPAVDFLVENDFMKVSGTEYRATEFGKTVSDLYIDPMSAVILREYLSRNYSEDSALYYLCRTPDMNLLPYRNSDYASIEDFMLGIDEEPESEDDLRAAKTAIVLREWINETPIRAIEESFSIGYGDIQSRVNTADWMSYSLSMLAKRFKPEIHVTLENLNFRIREGVREDIIRLTLIPRIGRVRARRLYQNGLRSIQDVADTDVQRISSIYGFSEKLATQVIQHARRIRKQ